MTRTEQSKKSAASVTVREGNVRMRVWRNITRAAGGRTYEAWEFCYTDENGHRQRLKRASKTIALEEARKVAERLAQRAATDWSAEETASFRAVKNNLFGCGETPEVATAIYAEARARLATIGRRSVLEAIEDFIARNQGGASDKSIADVVTELISFRKQDGAGDEHLEDLKSRLGRLVRDVKCRLCDLTPPVMEDWLRGMSIGNRTRKNYRAALSNLIGFAQSRGYLAKESQPMKSVTMPKQGKPKRGIFSPEEISWLLSSCTDSLLPVLVLGAFGGLRQSEALKLKWSDIDWEAGHIRIPEECKTGGRLAPLSDNLRAWLEPRRGHGPIVAISQSGVSKAIVRVVAKANAALEAQLITWRIKWTHNGPRHSFASYRCAATRDVAKVADEMGHSIRELARSYRNHKATPAQAKAWFEIRPQKAGNVLELPLLEVMNRKNFSPETHPKRQCAQKRQ